MALYSLNLHMKSGVRQTIGTRELPDVQAALAEAHASLRSLKVRDRLGIDPKGRIDIDNEAGQTVARVLLSEAFARM